MMKRNNKLLDLVFSKKFIISVGIFCTVILLYWLYYSIFVFHITHSSPSSNIMPTSYSTIEYSFNKPIKKQEVNAYISPSINDVNYVISKNKLTVVFPSPFGEDEQFELVIKDLESISGDKITIKKEYLVQYVEQKDLPEEDLKKLTKQSDSFENEYPLISKLPKEDSTYRITYRYPDKDNEKMIIIITSVFGITTNNPDGNPTDSDKAEYIEGLRVLRKAALKYLYSNGFNTKKYELYFSEPYITEEFGGKYIGEKVD